MQTQNTDEDSTIRVRWALIRPWKGQPRTYFSRESLLDLSASIKEVGQKTPIKVIRVEDDPVHKFEVTDGERRYWACELGAIEEMDIIVKTYACEADRFTDAVVSNFGREGHTAMEAARAIARIIADPRHSHESKSANVSRAAKLFAKSEAWAWQHLNLLELDPHVQKMLEPDAPEGHRLGTSIALFLHGIKDKKLQVRIAKEVAAKGLKLNAARRMARQTAEQAGQKVGTGRRYQPHDAHRALSRFLDLMSERSELLLETPGVSKLLSARSETERQILLAQIDENIGRLKELREAVERSIR